MVTLLIERFNEAPIYGSLHLSTLVQQVLSLTAQRGAVRADDCWRALCQSGPFANVSTELFTDFLKDLGRNDLLSQMGDGTLTLGLIGERLVNHYDFYTAFVTSDEYRLIAGVQTLGTLPVTRPVAIKDHILFAGRRWMVLDVRDDEKVIELKPAPAGRAPSFVGGGALVDDAIRRRMFEILESSVDYNFIDKNAARLLRQGRNAFNELDLGSFSLLDWGDDCLIFPWAGDRQVDSMSLMMRFSGLTANRDGVAILIESATSDEIEDAIARIVGNPPDPNDLVAFVANRESEKHHHFLSDDVLDQDWISNRLDSRGALTAFSRLAL